MKVYTAHIGTKNWTTDTVVCSTEEKAKEKIAAAIGFYLIDLLKDNTKAAVDFVEHLKIDGDNCILDTKGLVDYYIEEHEVDGEILS